MKSTFSGLQFCRWQYGSISICLASVVFQMYKIARNSKNIRTYSSSRSSNVIDLGVNQKPMYDLLVVITSNFQGWNCRGGWGVEPPSHVYRHPFLSENRLEISIPGQNFKHFGSWPPPSSFRSIPTLVTLDVSPTVIEILTHLARK